MATSPTLRAWLIGHYGGPEPALVWLAKRGSCNEHHEAAALQAWAERGKVVYEQQALTVPALPARRVLEVPCPHCGAGAGEACKDRAGKYVRALHRKRYHDAGLMRAPADEAKGDAK
jgi:hypothetical protein